VAWIAERKDVLSTFFWMLTLWAYIRYCEEETKKNHGLHASNTPHLNPNPNPSSAVPSVVKPGSSRVFYILALVFFALGLMAKPMLVTMPFVLLLLDWWPLRRLDPGGARLCQSQLSQGRMESQGATEPEQQAKFAANAGSPPRGGVSCAAVWRLVREKIPFFVLSVVFCILTMVTARSDAVPLTALPLTQRLGNSVVCYFVYVAKTIWPENMVVLYPFEFQWERLQIMGAGVFLVATSWAALRFCRTRPYFLFGWLWYLGILFPVIGLVQVGAQRMADRYTYVPSIGLFVIVCWGAWDMLGGWRHGKLTLGALGCAALLACALVAEKQLQYWRDSDTLLTHNLEITPTNYYALSSYGAHLYNTRRLGPATEELEKSIQIEPGYAFSHTVLGNILMERRQYDKAVPQFVIALQINPSAEDALLGYGRALLERNLPDDAARQLGKLLAEDPDNSEAHYFLGNALLKRGNLAGACAQFTWAMSLVKKYPNAQFQLAVALAREGKIKEAMANYRAAKNVPATADDSAVLNNLAWILAASPLPEFRDGPGAVELATRARDLDHSRQPGIIGTLAAAYAEAGRFDEAVAAAREARDLALAQGDQAVAARNLELLEIYRSHRAFHEQ
jgi:tetratricopeptide (TPR) repeat protein